MLGFFSSFYVKHKKTIVIRRLDLFLNWKKVQVVQSGPTLWDHMDYIVHGILQARILKWVVVPFSRGSSQPRDWTEVSHIADRFYQLSHQGSSRILEWVAYPFSSRSSWPKNWTGFSCIAGRFCTNWATREALFLNRNIVDVQCVNFRCTAKWFSYTHTYTHTYFSDSFPL